MFIYIFTCIPASHPAVPSPHKTATMFTTLTIIQLQLQALAELAHNYRFLISLMPLLAEKCNNTLINTVYSLLNRLQTTYPPVLISRNLTDSTSKTGGSHSLQLYLWGVFDLMEEVIGEADEAMGEDEELMTMVVCFSQWMREAVAQLDPSLDPGL